MGVRKQVPTWRIIPVEGECGKWMLVKGKNIMCGNENTTQLQDDDDRPMPSMADLVTKGLKTTLKKSGENVSPHRVLGPRTLNCPGLSYCKPKCSEFPVEEQITSNEHFSSTKQFDDVASSLTQNFNNSDYQHSAQSRSTPQKNTEGANMFRKTGRKRAAFSSSLRRQEPSSNNSSKNDGIQNYRPVESSGQNSDHQFSAQNMPALEKNTEGGTKFRKTGRKRVAFSSSFRREPIPNHSSKIDSIQNYRSVENCAVVSSRSTKETDEFVPLFQTAAGKPVGVSSSSLKRARAVLGEDISLEICATSMGAPKQINESVAMFQTAAGNSVTVSSSSIKRAQAIFCEDPTSEILESTGASMSCKMKKTGTMFQTATGNPVAVSSSSIKKAHAIFRDDSTSEVQESHAKLGPRTMDKAATMFHTPAGNHVTVSTSSGKKAQSISGEASTSGVLELHSKPMPPTTSRATSLFLTAAGNPVSVSSSSIMRAQAIFGEDSTPEVLEMHGKSEAHKNTEVNAMFQIAAGNPVTVLSSSIKEIQGSYGEDSTSEVPESCGRPKPQTKNKTASMFQTAAGNPVTVSSSSIRKAQAIFSEDPPSEIMDHGRSKSQIINNTSTMFQTAGGTCSTLSSTCIKGVQSVVQVDRDVQTVQNCSPACATDNSNKNLGPSKSDQTAFMFQTATGKPLTVSASSMKRAWSILGEDGKPGFKEDTGMFQSAEGKPVDALLCSIKAGETVLVQDAAEMGNLLISDTGGSDKKQTQSGHIDQTVLQDGSGSPFLFQRGAGNPVVIISSSMKNPLAILGQDPEEKLSVTSQSLSCLTTVYMQSVPDASLPNMSMHSCNGSLDVAGQILKSTKAAVHRPHPHESVFQTGCGNSVDVSIGGLSKTKAVLHAEGLEVPAESRVSKGTASLFSDLRSGQSKYFPNKDLVITADGSNVHSLGSSDTKSNRMHQFMFQTAEGQSVNVSTTAMKRAMNLLGNEIKRGATAVESVNSSGSFHSLSDLKTETIDSVEPPSLLFQTAGGRSVSISNAAMKRAMNLLGEAGGLSTTGMDVQRMSGDFMDSSANHSLRTVRHCNGIVSNKENLPYPAHISQVVSVGINTPPVKLCHVESMNFSTDSILSSKVVGFGIREAPMPLKFVHNGSCMDNDLSHRQEPVNSCFSGITKKPEASMVKETGARKLGKRKGCISPLAEISNKTPAYDLGNHCQGLGANSTVHGSILGSKRRSALSRYASPFKQPRRSRFLSPYDTSLTCAAVQPGLPVQSFPQEVTCEVKLQSLYPSNRKRKTMQEYFGGPPHHQQALWYLPNEIQSMTADAAQHYKFIAKSKSGDETYQSQDFGKLLLQSGADPRYTTTEWVDNHYRWIVWKLACIERSYARQAGGKYLTVQNVLEELKYRYEREVNRGHRSPLKKILEGDAAAARMMVVCVSAVRVWPTKELQEVSFVEGPKEVSKESENVIGSDIQKASSAHMAKIEITDGWYCLNAVLDEALSKQLLAGKLFVGQKLRICGASLHGWVGPLPPLEAFRTVTLVLRINGTYRAHWAERLSFCRGLPVPLAFRCIKEGGGPVPRTLVGVTRLYPILYKERLANQGFIIRSERAEDKTLHLYNERRAHIVEDVVLKSEKENFCLTHASNKDRDEGARLYSVLENAAEPELLMADMTSAQLAAFAAYQTKQEEVRRASIEKHIQKALEEADLESRKVTPFIRVRIVGLTCKCTNNCNGLRRRFEREGLVTIWQPTEKQINDLVEGAIYCVSGLVPLAGKSNDNFNRSIIQFQANRSTTWQRCSQSICEKFEFLFSPRSALLLSDLGKVPLYSEFDVAVYILHVGEPYACGLRKRQWLFASDSSIEVEDSNERSEIILAIDFSSPCDSFIPIDLSLADSTVGFCNLVKQKRDQNNSLWVAETTENSVHSLNFKAANFSHLRATAESVDKWAKSSLLMVEKLRQRVAGIICNTI